MRRGRGRRRERGEKFILKWALPPTGPRRRTSESASWFGRSWPVARGIAKGPEEASANKKAVRAYLSSRRYLSGAPVCARTCVCEHECANVLEHARGRERDRECALGPRNYATRDSSKIISAKRSHTRRAETRVRQRRSHYRLCSAAGKLRRVHRVHRGLLAHVAADVRASETQLSSIGGIGRRSVAAAVRKSISRLFTAALYRA